MRAPWFILALLGCTLPKPNTMNGLDSHHVRAWSWGTEITVDQATASFVAETNDYIWGGLSLVGDVNGDGLDDLMVGGESRVYLLYGRTEGWTRDESWKGKPSIVGTMDGQNPTWPRGLGDLNGDGLADVGIDHDGGNLTDAYLMLGSEDPWPSELPVDDVDVVAHGHDVLNDVWRDGPVGDLDGDGVDDWLLTVEDWDGDEAHVLAGAALAGEVPFPGPAVASSVHGEHTTDYNTIGDFTGDGLSDLGAECYADMHYYIVPGTSVPAEGLAVAVASSAWFDLWGAEVSPLGDVNVDGADDLAVSDLYEGIGLYFGGSENSGPITLVEADVVLAPGFHGSCELGGDLNGDGLRDLACLLYDASMVESYDTVVFFGRSDWPAVIDLEDADVRIRGKTGEELLVFESSTVGDIDGDGMDELVLAARYEDWNGVTQAGTVRVFRGRAAWPQEVERDDYDLLLNGDRSDQQLGYHDRFVLIDIDGDGADDMVSSLREETRNTTFIFFGEPAP